MAVSHFLVFTKCAYENNFREGQKLPVWYYRDPLDSAEFDNDGINCVNVYATIQSNIYKKQFSS